MEDKREISWIEYSTKYTRSFSKLPGQVREKARKRERIFRANPFEARLETHKLHGKFTDYWAYSVDNKNRVIFRFIDSKSVLFFDIGPHPIYGKGE